jgi:hypothetical protein
MGVTPIIILVVATPLWGMVEFILVKCSKKEVPLNIASPLKESLALQPDNMANL